MEDWTQITEGEDLSVLGGGLGGKGSTQTYGELIESPISLASCAKQTFRDKTRECYAGHTAIFL